MAKAVNLMELFPEADVDLITEMVNADKEGKISWKEIDRGPRTEADVFNADYVRLAQSYIAMYGADEGEISIKLFNKFRPIVDLFTRFVLKSDKTAGTPLNALLVGEVATGAQQAFIRPLTLRSFANASYTQLPGSTGAYNFLPTTTGVETATNGKQGWVFLGFVETKSTSIIPYDEIQASIDDTIGLRKPMYPYINMSEQIGRNLKIYGLTTPYFVQPSQTIDIDLTIRTANVEFGLFPLGVEVIIANAAQAVGPIA